MSTPRPAERPLLSFSRKTLDDGPRVVKMALPAAWLARQFEDGEPGAEPALTSREDGAIDARITSAGGNNFLLQGRVTARVVTSCARCLGPATVALDAKMTLLLAAMPGAGGRADGRAKGRDRRSKHSDGEPEFDADEADTAPWDGETLVLDPLVREALLLELPISPLCDEACPGMASPPEASPPLPVGQAPGHAAFRQKLAALKQELPPSPRGKPAPSK